MACPEVISQLCDELGENINSELCQDLRDHLDNCEDCRTCFDSIKKTVHLYQGLPDQDVPVEVTSRLYKMLNC